MHPLLLDSVPLYFVMWGCAALVGIAGATRGAVRADFPATRTAVALALLALSILAGSKLLYLAEAYWFPLDDYVPQEIRGSLHGFRIPGGILASGAALPVICRALNLSWRRFGDAVVPWAALALVFVRAGCFLNGCCFGKVSTLPWAVAFPRQSWVFWYHRAHGWVPGTAVSSLPVHPLQLYFLLAAGATAATLLWLQRRGSYDGCVQSVFYALFFGSTALLEPLRENFLTLNNWLAPLLAVVAGAVLVARALAVRGTAPVAVEVPR
jgi:phosphatidylglycerol---prolipoprotein diacylglyceryl transferase